MLRSLHPLQVLRTLLCLLDVGAFHLTKNDQQRNAGVNKEKPERERWSPRTGRSCGEVAQFILPPSDKLGPELCLMDASLFFVSPLNNSLRPWHAYCRGWGGGWGGKIKISPSLFAVEAQKLVTSLCQEINLGYLTLRQFPEIFFPLALVASPVAQQVKNPLAVWETWVQSLGWEDPLEKGKATHSSILAWRIPWTV